MRVKRSLPTVLICTWLMNNDMEHFLMCHPLCLLLCLAHFVNLPLRICLSALERKKEVGGKREREGERERNIHRLKRLRRTTSNPLSHLARAMVPILKTVFFVSYYWIIKVSCIFSIQAFQHQCKAWVLPPQPEACLWFSWGRLLKGTHFYIFDDVWLTHRLP